MKTETTRKLVTIETIADVQPIPDADAIEKVMIRGWWVVTKKGEYKTGDRCLYFEIDSLIPIEPQYEFLLRGNTPKKTLVDGVEVIGIRLKTIRLRGQVSQGLVMPLLEQFASLEIGTDVSQELNVVKFEPIVPPDLTNKVKGSFPGFLKKTDEERVQNVLHILETFKNHKFYITSKLDGMSVTFYKRENVFGCCSRNIDLLETEGNFLWEFAKKNNLQEKLPEGYAIQGELVGEGIQKNRLKLNGNHIFFFNVFDINNQKFLDLEDFNNFIKSRGLQTVPIITDNFILNHSLEDLLTMANNTSPLNKNVKQEGIVVRPLQETITNMGGITTRLSFKVISNEYLLKYND